MKKPKLTKNDEKIYRGIQILIRQQKKPTCAQIAAELGVAPSSIIKLAQKLGFSGWNEMYYSMTWLQADTMPLAIDNFDFIGESRVFERIRQLMDLLRQYRDRTIVVACMGDSEFLASYLLEKLWERDFKACRYSEQVLFAVDENPGEPGLCLFINESGILMLNVCIHFQNRKYKVFAITSSAETPLATRADYSLEIQNRKSSVTHYLPNFFPARAMIFFELLFAEIDESKRKAD